MRLRYVLCFDGQQIESSDIHELKRIVKGTECYWEIYKHIIPNAGGGGNYKLTILDMKEMLSMFEDGIDIKTIAKEFNICVDWAHKIIKQMRLEKIKKSINV